MMSTGRRRLARVQRLHERACRPVGSMRRSSRAEVEARSPRRLSALRGSLVAVDVEAHAWPGASRAPRGSPRRRRRRGPSSSLSLAAVSTCEVDLLEPARIGARSRSASWRTRASSPSRLRRAPRACATSSSASEPAAARISLRGSSRTERDPASRLAAPAAPRRRRGTREERVVGGRSRSGTSPVGGRAGRPSRASAPRGRRRAGGAAGDGAAISRRRATSAPHERPAAAR